VTPKNDTKTATVMIFSWKIFASLIRDVYRRRIINAADIMATAAKSGLAILLIFGASTSLEYILGILLVFNAIHDVILIKRDQENSHFINVVCMPK
jgi:hypothetical protein